MPRKIDTQSYIQMARNVHGDKYDYSRVNYKTMHIDVEIGCNEHGYFWKNARSHLRGSGCAECGDTVRITARMFLARSISAHGEKYGYLKTKFVNTSKKVTITCPIHGDFQQLPAHHMRGRGCSKCRDDGNRKTFDEFSQEAKKVHDDKYDYSRVKYKIGSENVQIICPVHGVFEQTPNAHLSGSGCIDCAGLRQLTTESFVERAKLVHGDRYDYSAVDYVNSYTNVTISCPKHGQFSQRPSGHLFGYGCTECGADRQIEYVRKDTAWFKKRARLVHGDKYDYSKANYKNLKTDIEIICPEHGLFSTMAELHIRGHHCRKCAGVERDTKMFVELAKTQHGHKYDYSLVHYKGSDAAVEIVCQIHGKFSQNAQGHLNGRGCQTCANESTSRRLLKYRSTEEFVVAAKAVHGNKYDYSRTDYKDTATKVTIHCPDHGAFRQPAANHLAGHGCQECVGRKKRTTEEFIHLALALHGEYYDYSLVEYSNAHSKVLISCPEHGLFEQIARDHLEGKPQCCANTGFKSDKPAILYYLRVTSSDKKKLYKIGITNRSVSDRFYYHDLEKIEVIEIVEFDRGRDAYDLEQLYLRESSEFAYSGPPVLSSGNTELFVKDVLGLDV